MARSERAPQLQDLVRAGCGAVLFGVPLLYTVEVWDFGSALPPAAGLALLIALVALATVLDRTAGFRFSSPRTWSGSFVDGIEVVAVSLVIGAMVLILIGELTIDSSLRAATMRIVAEAVPLTIGASIANEFLANASSDESPEQENRPVLGEAGGAAIGAVVIGLSIAPTDEVTMIAGQLPRFHVVALMIASLLASHTIVFESGIRRATPHTPHLRLDIGRTAVAYCVAVGVSVVMLGIYGRLLDGGEPRQIWVHVVTLAFPGIGRRSGRTVGRMNEPRHSDVVVSAVAAAIVVLFLVVTLWLTITEPVGPARFRIGDPVAHIEPTHQRVVIEITNVGGRTTEAVTVRATLPDESEIDQEATWLAPGERDEIGFVVGPEVAVGEIAFEVISFVEPG